MSKPVHLNASANLPLAPLNAAETKRKATAWLRKRGLLMPYRRAAMSALKEFKP